MLAEILTDAIHTSSFKLSYIGFLTSFFGAVFGIPFGLKFSSIVSGTINREYRKEANRLVIGSFEVLEQTLEANALKLAEYAKQRAAGEAFCDPALDGSALNNLDAECLDQLRDARLRAALNFHFERVRQFIRFNDSLLEPNAEGARLEFLQKTTLELAGALQAEARKLSESVEGARLRARRRLLKRRPRRDPLTGKF